MIYNNVGLIDDYDGNAIDYCPYDLANLNIKDCDLY